MPLDRIFIGNPGNDDSRGVLQTGVRVIKKHPICMIDVLRSGKDDLTVEIVDHSIAVSLDFATARRLAKCILSQTGE